MMMHTELTDRLLRRMAVAIDAVIAEHAMWACLEFADDYELQLFDAEFHKYRAEAAEAAYKVGYDFPEFETPPVCFWPKSECEYAFYDGTADRNRDDYQAQREQREADERQRTLFLIETGDWAALYLPSPSALQAELAQGEAPKVCGHRLAWEDGVLWFTNPYGIDGALGSELNEQSLADILTQLACGEEYGAVPY
jgi:hypothetical protein